MHKSTVSLALRHQSKIPAATRKRILRVADELGYAPDPLLDAFNFHRLAQHPVRASPVLAFVSDQPSRGAFEASALHRETYAGARERAAELGFLFDLFLAGPRQLSVARLDQVLQSRGISGVIVGALAPATTELPLDWSRYCVVAIDSFAARPPLDTVTTDHRAAARAVVRQLRALGHERIGFISTQAEDLRLQHRPLSGYLFECAREAPATIPPLLLDPVAGPAMSARLRAWVAQHRPTAALAACRHVQAAVLAGTLDASPLVTWAGLALPAGSTAFPGLPDQYRALGAAAAELLPLRLQTNQRGAPEHRTTIMLPLPVGGGATPPEFDPAARSVAAS